MNYQIYIQDWFSQTAERYSNNIAIDSGEQKFTYSEIETQSNKLANFLIEHGASKGSMVAILAQDSVNFIMGIIGILKAGCVFIPLVADLPEQRINTILSEVTPQWLIVDATGWQKISNSIISKFLQSQVICLGENAVFDSYAKYNQVSKPNIQVEPDDMCYLYFTSGSTGKPKGIAGRLKAISHFINWEITTLGITEGTRVSQLITPSFDAFLRDIFVPLCSGGVVCIPKEIDIILDARKLIAWIDNQKINLIHCVPSLFRSILNEDLHPKIFSSLQYILLSGEPLLPADVSRWMEVYGEQIQLVNLYGASETTMTKFFYFVKPTDSQRRFIPIGKPMEGAAALVVDERGKVCSPGMVGEIYVRTPYRTLGYYQQRDLTNQVFIPNPFNNNNPHDIVYKTGDLGRILEDGNFECLGRRDGQVKIRGVRIELGEIENQLRLHSLINDVVVVDREESHGNKYLCAYVVLKAEVESGKLRDFLLESLPESMIPSVFVVMEALPRTISGKVDRRSLPAPNRQNRTFVPPRTPIEMELAQIWGQVLNLDRVGLNDNFFELGGHSLNATQLVSRIGKAFQVELPLRSLFDAPTLATQAESIETLRWAKQKPLVSQFQVEGALEEGEL